MFEKNVDKFILQDALKLSLQDYLLKNYKCHKVKKGLNGKIGECIKNSINFDSNKIIIGFAIFTDNTFINTINIIIHAVNYNDKGELIDNTDIRNYDFYEIESISSNDYYEVKSKMIEVGETFKELAILNFNNIYKDIKVGNFSFDVE